MTAYAWTHQQPPLLPQTLPPVHRTRPHGLEGTLIDGAEWLLRSAGLLDVLDRVTGDADALQSTATHWLTEAATLRSISLHLRQGAAALEPTWTGDASTAFATFLGTCVATLDALTADLSSTAHLLNRAAAAAGLAEDLVTGVVADAAEWAAAELAATAVADLLTLGLASLAGGLAESATMAVFVDRAVQISVDFGRTLELLAQEFVELKKSHEAIHAAEGLAKLKELRNTRAAIDELELLGTAYRALQATTDTALGLTTGLPLDTDGARRFGAVLGRTLGEEKDVARTAL